MKWRTKVNIINKLIVNSRDIHAGQPVLYQAMLL